ncbi:DNA polymerase epsilon subunit 3 isoform X2 [Balaenoptera ricei]|uniref:DNA polymerase epsilon subunit 3 isoform X2 n=1 Tax=Balaenoptera ricei TaxID=2746895 RepID=UPI0028BE55BE|nr:DNA polymerase epsilon subunit 3 isoform X2 [Balaenoptera ricei]
MFYLSGERFRALVQGLQSLKQNKTTVTLYRANNFAMKGKRKTLNASDVLSAMEEMEFQRFVTPLKEALEAYRREQKGKKEASEQKKKDKDKKTDSEEQDKGRDEDNDEDEERLEEEEQNEEEEVDN